jgi:hypothetical protein
MFVNMSVALLIVVTTCISQAGYDHLETVAQGDSDSSDDSF